MRGLVLASTLSALGLPGEARAQFSGAPPCRTIGVPDFVSASGTGGSATHATIPVHFHVVTYNEDGRLLGDLSDAIIHEVVGGLNTTYAGTPFSFTLVEITRTTTGNRQWFDRACSSLPIPSEIPTPRGQGAHLNIYGYGGKDAGGCWYVTSPGAAYDNLYIGSEYLTWGPHLLYGIPTHEVGHWLSLAHTCDGGCSEPGDHVADTPACIDVGDANRVACDASLDTCPSFPGNDTTTNWMGNNGVAGCSGDFTAGQIARAWDYWVSARNPDPGDEDEDEEEEEEDEDDPLCTNPNIPSCGDTECNPGAGENCQSCACDCPCGGDAPYCVSGSCVSELCGNGACLGNENCETCRDDCGDCPVTPFCGNGICGDSPGEGVGDCYNCPEDCGCPPSLICHTEADPDTGVPHGGCVGYCGNGICGDSAGEDCGTCGNDCPCWMDNTVCVNRQCVQACTPSCNGGCSWQPDGCGGWIDCGPCPEWTCDTCADWSCDTIWGCDTCWEPAYCWEESTCWQPEYCWQTEWCGESAWCWAPDYCWDGDWSYVECGGYYYECGNIYPCGGYYYECGGYPYSCGGYYYECGGYPTSCNCGWRDDNCGWDYYSCNCRWE